jgi:Lon protease-like protein
MLTEHDRNPPGKGPSFQVPDRIPLFPLPNVVFFPRMYLPLHVFEPRYREMVSDAVASGQCIGMVLLKEGWEQDYYGNPPIYQVGCVGRLVSMQKLSDGRSNILLQGLHRFEIREQFYEKSYREARVALKPAAGKVTLDPSVRSDLVRALEAYLKAREDGHQWQGLFCLEADDEILVNSLSASLEFTPLEKQFLMEADNLLQRARRLINLIQFGVYERDGAKGWG